MAFGDDHGNASVPHEPAVPAAPAAPAEEGVLNANQVSEIQNAQQVPAGDPGTVEIVDGQGPIMTPTPDVAPDTAPATPEDLSADNGAVTRLQQQVAANNSVMNALGIDPDSDIAEKFKAGIYSRQDLLEMVGIQSKPPVAPPTTQPAVYQTQDQLQTIIDRVKTEGAGEQDFVEAMTAIQNTIQQANQAAQANTMNNTLSQCANTTKAVIASQDSHTTLPQDLKAIEEQLFLAGTDNLVLREANGSQNPDAFLTPNSYGYYANKFNSGYQKLVNHYINVGRDMQKKGIAPVHQNGINPVSPQLGSGPVTPAAPVVNRTNWQQAAKNYMSRQSQV